VLFPAFALAAPLPKPICEGLKWPTAIAVTPEGRVFVCVAGEMEGNGAVVEIKAGKAVPIVEKFDRPLGIVYFKQKLFVVDKKQVRRIDIATGKADIWAEEKDFPMKPVGLNGITADERGTLYVSDSQGQAIFRIAAKPLPKGSIETPERTVSLVSDGKAAFRKGETAYVKSPQGLVMDSLDHLLVLDSVNGELKRLTLATGKVEIVADNLLGGYGISFDHNGQLFITDGLQGRVWAIPRPGIKPIFVTKGMQISVGLAFDAANHRLLLVDYQGNIVPISNQVPGWEVDVTPLNLQPETAFGGLKWTGWDSGEETGKINALRPVVLTHAGDGSNRVFVATQQGVIHSFADDQAAKETKVFLDIQSKVLWNEKENEQGLLGLAFHPKFKTNGEFFVFYTDKTKRLENVLCRYKVSKDDPNKADPASEQELLRISHKYWNHDGGTVAFGPDGFLYVVLGDGGLGGDPDDHGQALDTILGKVLRIDIDGKSEKAPYAIPKDNPFVSTPNARPEIFAYGLRNPWRMSFDRKTGQGWVADVGQNLWEEINLLEKGGNYGWRRRESQHPFAPDGTGPKKEFIEPIWEYHHELGKSITGGHVYRGKALPELDGHYLYADYVTGKIWALKYDETKKRVVANRPILGQAMPILSFGEDEKGEAYFLTAAPNGKGISRFVPKK
jgi:glucose/arabinose dehydrogenase